MNQIQKRYSRKAGSYMNYIAVTFGMIFILLISALLFLPPHEAQRTILVFSAIAVFIIISIVRSLKRTSIVIQHNNLYYHEGKKTYHLHDIYQEPIQLTEDENGEFTLHFKTESTDSDESIISIELSKYEGSNEVAAWVKKQLPLSNLLFPQAETTAPGANAATQELPEPKSKKTSRKMLNAAWKSRAKALSNFSIAFFFWLSIYPLPQDYAPLCCLLFTWYCIAVPKLSKNAIKLSVNKSGTKVPIVGHSVLLSGGALWMYLLGNIHVVSYISYLPLYLIFFLLYAGLLFFVSGRARTELHTKITAVGLGLFLSFGTVGVFNSIFYTKTDRIVSASIIGKQEKYSRHIRKYYLKLQVNPVIEKDSMYQVGQQLYSRYAVGDVATIHILDGNFGIPFYKVR